MGMRYYGGRRSIAPSLTNDNWTLSLGTGIVCRVVSFNWGGEATTSTAMHTRVARSSGAAGAGTPGNVGKQTPNLPANGVSFFTTYATTQPVLDAGDLFQTSWNDNGGLVRWASTAWEEMILIGAATPTTLSCRNSVGTGVSSYGVVWEEF